MQRRALVLLVVMGVLVVLCTFALSALYLRTQEARVAELRISRMHSIDAIRSGIVYATARLNEDSTWDNAVNIMLGNPYLFHGRNVNITITNATTNPSCSPEYCIDAEVVY